MIFLWSCFIIFMVHLHGMQMMSSILFLTFTFKDQNLVENLKKLAETLKIVGPCGVHVGSHFPTGSRRPKKRDSIMYLNWLLKTCILV